MILLLAVAAMLVLGAWWDRHLERRHHDDVQRYIDPNE